MAAPNPFFEGDDLIEDEIENDEFVAQPAPDERETEHASEFQTDGDPTSLDHIAFHLLKENLILTALELHTELLEAGKELPRLRNYFSNPANFERTKFGENSPPGLGLARTSSIQTFDSLDFARYSDDGEKESDKVAVLEFELRKAQDTIRSLRATLTKAAETELPSPANDEAEDCVAEDFAEDEPIRQYERRALNFLVNEYMLLNDYKLSSVTFAEENENQDFEDWDDVGLNLPKPPDLLHLYRDYGNHAVPIMDSCDASVMVAMEIEAESKEELQIDMAKFTELEEQIQRLLAENAFLSNQLKHMERDAETLQSLKVHSSTPAISPISTPSKSAASENGRVTSDDPPPALEIEDTNDSVMAEQGTELPDHSLSDAPIRTDNNRDEGDGSSIASFSWQSSKRNISPTFRSRLLQTAFHVASDNRIITEVSKLADSSSEKVLLMLGRCLPHIVPNVLLAKREELIPVIICTATLHPNSKERDELLNILFNLIKRPDPEQRQMILTGCVAFAQHVGASRVESELLPQCWEQIGHKYVERRQLVAEACGALAPFLPNEIVSSLVLSMLQQMSAEERAEEVRAAVTKSLGILMGVIHDADKYSKCCQLLFSSLLDSSEMVASAAQSVFLPAFAVWAQELGRLESNLIQHLMDRIDNLTTKQAPSSQTKTCGVVPADKKQFCLFVEVLISLVPVIFSSVLCQGPYVHQIEDSSPADPIILTSRFPSPQSQLFDLSVLNESPERLAALLSAFEKHISAEWFEPWEAVNWVAGTLVPELISLMNQMDPSALLLVQSLTQFHLTLCRTFGRTFTLAKIRPRYQNVLCIPEDSIDTRILDGETGLTKMTVPIYAAGVLGAFNEDDDLRVLMTFLQDLLCTLSLCQAPLASLKAACVQLSADSKFHDLLLSVLWDSVVHTSANIRSTAAKMFELLIQNVNESLVANRIVPALVTLASDPEISVRIATVAAFGTILENVTERTILDKVYMQFQTFMDDPFYRDQHALHIELVRTFARVGPNAEPAFRDEFVLPRLCIMAANNANVTSESRRLEVALQLFEAYSALSCCFISDQLISEAMLPGLRCLLADLQQIAPDHVDVVASMVREFEARVESNRLGESLPGAAPMINSGQNPDDMKSKMLSRFKDVRDRASHSKPNFSKIFGSTKK